MEITNQDAYLREKRKRERRKRKIMRIKVPARLVKKQIKEHSFINKLR